MDHSIEDGTAQATFDLLVSPATCLQLVADEVLIAIDLRFRQRTSVILACFHALRPWCRMARRISSLANAGALQLPCCWILASLRSAMRGRIAGPLRGVAKASKTFCLSYAPSPPTAPTASSTLRGIIDPMGRQRLGDHLTGGLMDPHMQFAPSPPFGPAVLTDFPLALTVDFQAGRIYHQVHRFIGALTPPPSSLGDATRSSNPASPIHQVQKRLDKALRLAQRQPKQHPQSTHSIVGSEYTIMGIYHLVVRRIRPIISTTNSGR